MSIHTYTPSVKVGKTGPQTNTRPDSADEAHTKRGWLNNGNPPILLEPVKANIAITDRAIRSVNVLDHDGRRTGRTLPVKAGQFALDGTKDRAIYY